jgi:hypothetical protein
MIKENQQLVIDELVELHDCKKNHQSFWRNL